MDDCLFLDDVYEIEFWFETVLVDPPNLPKLHAEGKIVYEWSGSIDDYPEYTLKGTDDRDRIAKIMYREVMSEELSEADMRLEVTVKATDTRFTQLEVSDTATLIKDWQLPCVTIGNSPSFSIADASIVELDSGEQSVYLTISASEAVAGEAITVDYCTSAGTASSFSTEVQVKHAAYDVEGNPFISYLEFGDVRVNFDASFPKYYGTFKGTERGDTAKQLYVNALNWLDHSNLPNKVLVVGDNEGAEYNVKGTNYSGFKGVLDDYAVELGYSVTVAHLSEITSPTTSYFKQFSVVVFMSSYYSDTPTISEAWVKSLERAVRAGVGLLVITDHTAATGSFAINGNEITKRFYAEFKGSIDRTGGTDFDAVRAEYGDHPLIQGITGTMVGDSSEGYVETMPPSVENPKDYESECGSVTFEPGESTKQIGITVYGDEILEGDENFFVDISNPTRGTIQRGRATVIIEGDDSVPCGTASSAGGDGVEWFNQSIGSEAGVVIITWVAFSQHDRFDVFRDGVHVNGSNHEIDTYLASQGNVHSSYPVAYDYDRWKELFDASGTRAQTLADMGSPQHPNRAGAGAIMIPHYPLEQGHPSIYQVRSEGGGSGTAWNLATYCLGQAMPALEAGGTEKTFDNRLWQQASQHVDVLDLSGFGSRQYTIRFKPQEQGAFPTEDVYDELSSFQNQYFYASSQLKSKMVLKSNNLVIGETAYISRTGIAEITFDYEEGVDFRYLEVHVICSLEDVSEYMTYWTDGTNGKSIRVRNCFEYTVR